MRMEIGLLKVEKRTFIETVYLLSEEDLLPTPAWPKEWEGLLIEAGWDSNNNNKRADHLCAET